MGPFLLVKVQKKFVIVACKYSTKWVEAEAVAIITQRSVEKFMWENVICKFGILQTIILNNGPQLKGEHITQSVRTSIYGLLHISGTFTNKWQT